MTMESSGNGALTPDDHDRVVRLEAAVDELRKDVGEDSNEGIRGKLDDHIKTCGKRWEDLALEINGLQRELRGMTRMLLWSGGVAAFVVTAGLVILGLVLHH